MTETVWVKINQINLHIYTIFLVGVWHARTAYSTRTRQTQTHTQCITFCKLRNQTILGSDRKSREALLSWGHQKH